MLARAKMLLLADSLVSALRDSGSGNIALPEDQSGRAHQVVVFRRDRRGPPKGPQTPDETRKDVERRRRKLSLADVEFSGGYSELLHLHRDEEGGRRFGALFHLHFCDRVVTHHGCKLSLPSKTELAAVDWLQRRVRGVATEKAACDLSTEEKQLLTAPPSIADTTLAEDEALKGNFKFTLYTENIETASALLSLSTRFSIPRSHFFSSTLLSKYCCASQKCFVRGLPLCLLASVNTMRFPGYVLRVSDIEPCSEEEWSVVNNQEKIANHVILLRNVTGSPQEVNARLETLKEEGFINYRLNSVNNSIFRAASRVLHHDFGGAVAELLTYRGQKEEVLQFLRNPNAWRAMTAREHCSNTLHRTLLKNFATACRSSGTADAMAHAMMSSPSGLKQQLHSSLISALWNRMASQRIRQHGLEVVVGDAVVLPGKRADAPTATTRQFSSVSSRDVKVVQSEAEAKRFSIYDVVIPQYRHTSDWGRDASAWPKLPCLNADAYRETLKKMGCEPFALPLDEAVAATFNSYLSATTAYRSVVCKCGRLAWQFCMRSSASTPAYLRNDRLLLQGEEHPPPEGAAGSHIGRRLVMPHSESAASPSCVVLEPHSKEMVLHQPESDVDSVTKAMDVCIEIEVPPRSTVETALREVFAMHGVSNGEDANLQGFIHHEYASRDVEWDRSHTAEYCWVCFGRDHTDSAVCAVHNHRFAMRRVKAKMAASEPPLVSKPPVPAALGGATPLSLTVERERGTGRQDSLGMKVDDSLRVLCFVQDTPSYAAALKTGLLSTRAGQDGKTSLRLTAVDGVIVKTPEQAKQRLMAASHTCVLTFEEDCAVKKKPDLPQLPQPSFLRH